MFRCVPDLLLQKVEIDFSPHRIVILLQTDLGGRVTRDIRTVVSDSEEYEYMKHARALFH